MSGSERMRLPVAAKMALHTAGVSGRMAGSPCPPQKPPLGTSKVSTLGISDICGSRKSWKFDSVMRPSFTVFSW